MRANSKRLERLHGLITAAPVLHGVLDEAYEWFTMFGELPEEAAEDHVALAVIRRAMNGGVDKRPPSNKDEFAEQLRDELHSPKGVGPSVRWPLFEETLHEDTYVRCMARSAIAVEVAYGGNVESPGFAGHRGLPVFGTVGMHVLGYPARWIAPPYEFQGERLLRRLDELRARIDQGHGGAEHATRGGRRAVLAAARLTATARVTGPSRLLVRGSELGCRRHRLPRSADVAKTSLGNRRSAPLRQRAPTGSINGARADACGTW